MWDAGRSAATATSPEMLERIHRSFRLWEKASAGLLRFEYAGFSASSYDSVTQVPYDGCVHAVLNGRYNFHGELGIGGFKGDIPQPYKKGYLLLNKQHGALDSSTVIHEIGHALGLPHAATNASALFSGPRAWGRGEPEALTEQDGADLRARWAPGNSGAYSISGTIETARDHPMAFVFAVDSRSGRVHSVRADPMGRFAVAITRPGEYRLLAKAVEASGDVSAQIYAQAPGWFVSDGVSSKDPAQSAVLNLSADRPAISGVRLKMIDEPVPFLLTRAVVVSGGELSALRPGGEAVFELPEAGSALASVKSYGSRPDYDLRAVDGGGKGPFRARVKIFAGAVEGERLVVARARDGRVAVGLVGINVVKPEKEAR